MEPIATPRVDFSAAVPLALTLDFSRPHPRHFGAPAASSEAFKVDSFEGDVARGASCNCRQVHLVPHCNGTHTESASHLTIEQRPLQEILPAGPMVALLLTVAASDALSSGEDSIPAPQAGDRLITRGALLSAWGRHPPGTPRALLLRTGTDWSDPAPPFLSRQLVQELVARGVDHLVTDLPSVDRLADEGRLSAHRIFFGLPADSTRLGDAARASATITELAAFPAGIPDGPCAVQIQIPAWTGDAVPSRPLYLPLVAAS
ncbi:MAG TPA: cyclase family protein [Steroidobacteraceae bacterium]|nr:cyclase family protein [Steroidobacteraceae bacterium]